MSGFQIEGAIVNLYLTGRPAPVSYITIIDQLFGVVNPFSQKI